MSNVEKETLVPLADAAEVGLGVGRRTLGRRIKNPPPASLRFCGLTIGSMSDAANLKGIRNA